MSFLGGVRRSYPVDLEYDGEQYEDTSNGDLWAIRRERNPDRSRPYKYIWTLTNDTQLESWGSFYSSKDAMAELKKHVAPGNIREL